MCAIDRINDTMGSGTLIFAGTGLDPQWKRKADHLTACYTTRWADLPVSKISTLGLLKNLLFPIHNLIQHYPPERTA